MTLIERAEALELCQHCPDNMQNGCIISDIESSRKEAIEMPKCMIPLTKSSVAGATSEGSEGSKALRGAKLVSSAPLNDKFAPAYDEKVAPASEIFSSTDTEKLRPPVMKKLRLPPDVKLDDLDKEILGYVTEGRHRNDIIKQTGKPAGTVRRRLERLIKVGLIKPLPRCVTYALVEDIL
jgi:uncharacterized membrane protein